MLQFEKEKTILEMQSQKILMYYNVIIFTFLSSLAGIWFSSDIILTIEWKIVITLYAIVLFFNFYKSFSVLFNSIETKIRML